MRTIHQWPLQLGLVSQDFAAGQATEVRVDDVPAEDTKLVDLKSYKQAQRQQAIERRMGLDTDGALRRAVLEQERLAGIVDAQARIFHDLGNMHMVVDGCCTELEAILDDSNGRPAVEVVEELQVEFAHLRAAMKHMHTLHQSHRQLTRQTSRGRAAHSVAAMLDEVAQWMNRGHQSRIVTHCPEDLVVYVDSGEVTRIFVNLITNARQAFDQSGHEDGVVTLSARQRGCEVEIDIRDNGPGIPANARARVFQAVFSTKVGTAKSGLGLAICKELAIANGGDIELLAPTQSGAAFSLTLPLWRQGCVRSRGARLGVVNG